MKTAKFIRANRRQRGFTIVELMITLAIAGILLGIVVPSFKNMIASSKLTTQTNEIVAAITFARSEAIKSNASHTFCRASSNTATTCNTTAGNWEFWIIANPAGTVVRRGTINTYGNTLKFSSTLSSNQVVFGSDGRARTNNAPVNNHAIGVCTTSLSTNNTKQVVLGSGSRISVVQSTGAC